MSCEIQPARHNHQPNEAARPGPKRTKMPFRAKLGLFWAKNPNFYWRKHKFWYPHNGKTTRTPCSHCFLVGHGTKWEKNANVWPKITKNANFLPNLTIFGSKFLILTKWSKSFGTHVTEKPHRHHVRIVFWFVMESNGPKMPIFGQKSKIWPFLGQKSKIWPFLGQTS